MEEHEFDNVTIKKEVRKLVHDEKTTLAKNKTSIGDGSLKKSVNQTGPTSPITALPNTNNMLQNMNVEAENNFYRSIIATRYCYTQMSKIFSPKFKYKTWRLLWLNLAIAQKELGLNVTKEQIDEMRSNLDNINFDNVSQYEKRFKHDVMAHIHAFGDVCPTAMPIIHLGATSCFVTDNGDLLVMKKAIEIIIPKLCVCLNILSKKCFQYKNTACLGFTHFQPAQLTTVGKRMCVWLQDLFMDLNQLITIYDTLIFRGAKGTTGTQASFLNLFNGDIKKVNQLDQRLTELCNFPRKFTICGQTYTRKLDCHILSAMAGIGSSMHKICTDLRLLSNSSEMSEPFSSDQIGKFLNSIFRYQFNKNLGSSAMAYKQNPVNLERCCSLSRRIMSISGEALQTHALQWLERSLDDSAIRRIYIPESFILTDSVISHLQSIFNKIQVNEKIIANRVKDYLPLMVTENIIMEMTKKGANRQVLFIIICSINNVDECHELVRKLSLQSSEKVKQGHKNDLIDLIRGNAYFNPIHPILEDLLNNADQYTGCAAYQVNIKLEIMSYLSAFWNRASASMSSSNSKRKLKKSDKSDDDVFTKDATIVSDAQKKKFQSLISTNTIVSTPALERAILLDEENPSSDLHIDSQEIKMGTILISGVYLSIETAFWHGHVLIHKFDRYNFKLEISILSSIYNCKALRHQNLSLFMGASIEPEYIIIMTGISQYTTLYSIVHKIGKMLLGWNLNLSKNYNLTMYNILLDIAHALDYLHSKQIHCGNLSSKQIFVGNETKLHILDCDPDLLIPSNSDYANLNRGKISYYAPELLKTMYIFDGIKFRQKFSIYSDIYAYG
ncbi:hypothetical protein A3Q56_04564 [Intoshia linei]|uniref:Adenylosuccinate lyase n=1 Tax=Intoshia linei TaxID=1819745 RepID=A0A177B250_9BILA|nr:hypothetical protein A3Q56_04564 [Intoshia linei]